MKTFAFKPCQTGTIICNNQHKQHELYSPRARRLLFNPQVFKVVSTCIVELYAEFKYARLTKIGCCVNSQFHFK